MVTDRGGDVEDAVSDRVAAQLVEPRVDRLVEPGDGRSEGGVSHAPTTAQARGLPRQRGSGECRVAAARRAVGMERAPVAQALTSVGRKSSVRAGALDRRPDRVHLRLEGTGRLVGRGGDDGDRIGQVEQLDSGGPPTEEPLAEAGRRIAPRQAALLVGGVRAGGRSCSR